MVAWIVPITLLALALVGRRKGYRPKNMVLTLAGWLLITLVATWVQLDADARMAPLAVWLGALGGGLYTWGSLPPAIGALLLVVGGLACHIAVWKHRGYRPRRTPGGFVADDFIAGGEPFDFERVTNPPARRVRPPGGSGRRGRRRGRPRSDEGRRREQGRRPAGP